MCLLHTLNMASHILSLDTSENKVFSFRKKKAAEINNKKYILTRKKGQNLNWKPGFQMQKLLIFSRDSKWVSSFLLTAIAFFYSQ